MAASLHQRLETIKLKLQMLTDRYRTIRQEKQAADERLADMQRVVKSQQREIDRLRQQVEHLTVVTTLAPDRGQVAQTRGVLSELVREIDKCINELNQ